MPTHIVRLATLALCVCLPAGARAWTEAQVTSASARLDITDRARAQVELEVGLHVTGGWLSRFELLDLDDDLEPSVESPALLVGADGRTYSPAVIVRRAGSVVFAFADRHTAPRRGDYSLRFNYATRALRPRTEPQNDDSPTAQAASWSLPRWPVRLTNVYIVVVAPKGTRPTDRHERERTDLSGDDVSIRKLPNAVELSFRRVELPRTQSFAVSVELPQPSKSPRDFAPDGAYLPNPTALLLGLALGLAWLAKRRWTLAACRKQELIPRPLLPIGAARWRDCASFALCASAVPLFAELPVLAAIGGVLGAALSIDITFTRGPAASATSRPHGYRSFVARASTTANWLDVTTPMGACTCAIWYALLASLDAQAAISCSAWLTAPLFFTATQAARRAVSDDAPAHEHASRSSLPIDSRALACSQSHSQAGHPASSVAQPAFLRSSSTTVSSSLSSRPTTSG